MKKTLALLLTVLGTMLTVHAEIGSFTFLEQQATNYVTRGTTRVAFAQRLNGSSTFATAAHTNMAYLVTNRIAAVPATSAVLLSGGVTAGAALVTNTYVLNKGVTPSNMVFWTNVVVTASSNNWTAISELSGLGDYAYVQLVNISNNTVSTVIQTNHVSLHWK